MNPAANYRTHRGHQLAMEAYERALASWPVPAQRHIVPTHLGETFALSWGKPANPALVLLHGSAANLTTWGGDAEAFGRNFHVFAIDLPGETGKSTSARPPYAGDDYTRWLAEVLDGLELPHVSLTGLSLGGWLALRFAAAAPNRVERLAVLAPGGVGPARKSFLVKVIFFRLFGKRGIERITRVVFSPEAPPPGAAEVFSFALQHYRERRDNLPLIPDEELRSVAAPTLFLAGAKDALLDMPTAAARMASLVPHATIEVDLAAGHALIGKADRVLQFFESNPVLAAPR